MQSCFSGCLNTTGHHLFAEGHSDSSFALMCPIPVNVHKLSMCHRTSGRQTMTLNLLSKILFDGLFKTAVLLSFFNLWPLLVHFNDIASQSQLLHHLQMHCGKFPNSIKHFLLIAILLFTFSSPILLSSTFFTNRKPKYLIVTSLSSTRIHLDVTRCLNYYLMIFSSKT